jgi:phage baseplate assembly protein W
MALREDKYTQTAQKTDVFSDFLNNFNVHPATGQLIRQVNEDVVKRSIRNLILTNTYERVYKPEIGSDIKKSLFDPVSPITEIAIKDSVTSLIENFEKRADLIDVVVSVQPDENAYNLSILFYVISAKAPISLDLTLYRVR